MTVKELHIALATKLGDTINISPNSALVPDGTRYSKALKDIYINNAAIDIIRQIVNYSLMLPSKLAKKTLDIIFPTYSREMTINISTSTISSQGVNIPCTITSNSMTKRNTTYTEYIISLSPTAFNNYLPLHYINLSGVTNGFMIYPIPIKYGNEVEALLNSRNVQLPDDFAYQNSEATSITVNGTTHSIILPKIHIISQVSNPIIRCRFIPYPFNISYMSINDYYPYEEMLISKLLNTATAYGLVDSQDIQLATQVSQLINDPIIPQIQGNTNA